jgi:hypothetical protein
MGLRRRPEVCLCSARAAEPNGALTQQAGAPGTRRAGPPCWRDSTGSSYSSTRAPHPRRATSASGPSGSPSGRSCRTDRCESRRQRSGPAFLVPSRFAAAGGHLRTRQDEDRHEGQGHDRQDRCVLPPSAGRLRALSSGLASSSPGERSVTVPVVGVNLDDIGTPAQADIEALFDDVVVRSPRCQHSSQAMIRTCRPQRNRSDRRRTTELAETHLVHLTLACHGAALVLYVKD